MTEEGQGYPCYQHDMMMMMIIHIYQPLRLSRIGWVQVTNNNDNNDNNWYSHQRISKINGRPGNGGTSGVYPNYSNAKIGQDTEKSPGDLRRLAVTKTPVKDHQLMLV